MRLRSHFIGGVIAAAASVYSITYIHPEYVTRLAEFIGTQPQVQDFWPIFALILLAGSIINDLDNPSSIIGRILFPISIPAHIISLFIYKMLYPRSWQGLASLNGKTSFFGMLAKSLDILFKTILLRITYDDFLNQRDRVAHRVLFHSDIGLILFWLLFSHFGISMWYFIAFSIGYCTHILLDYIQGKILIPVLLRILFKLIGIKKETIGLKLRIG